MSRLIELAQRLAKNGPVKTLPTPRLVQALLNGSYVFKTTEALFVWEMPFFPQLYVPKTAFTSDVVVKEINTIKSEVGSTIAHQLSLTVGSKSIDQAFVFVDGLEGDASSLSGYVKVDFAALDQWFEESTPIYVHPKDPFKRVDILQSLRPLRISIDGVEVASTSSSMHLYETGLPTRYYLPRVAVHQDLLRPSSTTTKCPYKGEAEYFSVEVNGTLHEDVIWYYRSPLLESIKIEGLLCFYNEKVDIELDGKKLDRPQTPFSRMRAGQRPAGV